MGILGKLKGEQVDIIEWIDDSRSTLAWRFPRYQNEIKNGAELIVREGQQAAFVYRGELADVFGPGHGILPFQVDEGSARQAVSKWTRSRWLAPREFKKYNRASAFSSVYMAYFTYDADTRTSYEGQRGTNYTVTVGSGNNRRTETRTRWRSVSGRVTNRFDDILVHANEGLKSRHVAGLEPWPLTRVEPFSAEYVAGHLCRTYDRDVERCFDDAEEVVEKEVTRTVKRDIGGDKQRVDSMRTSYKRLTYKHLLLPLWLLTVAFAGQTYQVLVNGATGEVKGERPWSKVKIALVVLAVLVVVAVALAIYAMSGG